MIAEMGEHRVGAVSPMMLPIWWRPGKSMCSLLVASRTPDICINYMICMHVMCTSYLIFVTCNYVTSKLCKH